MSDTLSTLLDCAEDAIRLRGYHAVSFRDLAEKLGIKSSSVHYYFRQKEDLGLALVQRYRDRFYSDLEAQAAQAKTPDDKIHA
ncbi:MAG: TetR/AcrR family transcriptional regulator, partial [Hyphomicrobiaceae bacterium]